MTGPDRAQFHALAQRLEARHDLFAAVWEMGRPEFSREIHTACVEFDGRGEWVRFLFNPEFWDRLDDYGRDFVVCHEVLHVVLAHGVRSADLENRRLVNVAADLVVNHLLVDKYGFVRGLVRGSEALCWRDTVFEVPWVRDVETFEGYYHALERTPNVLRNLVDAHAFATNRYDRHAMKRRVERFHRALRSRLGDEAVRELASGLEWCEGRGWTDDWGEEEAEVAGGHAKANWAFLLRRAVARADVPGEPSWKCVERRLASAPLALPGSAPGRGFRGALFVDMSGSCWEVREPLVRVARSLEGVGAMDLYAFDVRVMPLARGIPRVRGGGGTDFRCIEAELASRKRYPDLVLVVTDGFGEMPQPKHPARWHWLLTAPCPLEFLAGTSQTVLSPPLATPAAIRG